jgi:flagellar biosynthesis protein FlhG
VRNGEGLPVADQAKTLRSLVEKNRSFEKKVFRNTRSMAIVSGKGGVGKSSLSVNLALAIADLGFSVVLLDADMGMANVDLMLGLVPRYSLAHVIRGSREIREILIELDDRVWVIPGGSGVREMAEANEDIFLKILEQLTTLDLMADYLIIDTGAGIHKDVLSFALAADSVVVVTTPEPTSVRDAYGIMKILAIESKSKADMHLVVNMADNAVEAGETAERMQKVSSRFLSLNVDYDGFVPIDRHLKKAICSQRPLLREFPNSVASYSFREIASRLTGAKQETAGRGLKAFFLRLARGLRTMEMEP